ncbi:hypothetical protein [Nocardiopsis nanhaiensis]
MDQALQKWACHATEEELDTGPHLEDLGGANAVIAEAAALATSPQLPYLLTALSHSINVLSDEQATPLLAAAAHGLRNPYAAWVHADALDILCTQPELAARLGSRCIKDLATLAERALSGDSDAALAQSAISGLLRLAVAGQTPPHRLLALLTDIDGTESADALERLPILIGLAHDHFSNTNELLNVLGALENRTELAPTVRADASFELALADERTALEASDPATAEERLRRALMRFAELDHTHGARLDARAHAAAIRAVLAFADLEQSLPTDDSARQRLTDAADQLNTAATNLAAWTSRMHKLEWLSARGIAQASWSRLVTTLHIAQRHLGQPSWYNPANALNDLLQIYLASRSIHTPTSNPQGFTALISPTVEAPFIHREGLLHHLEQALSSDPQFINHPDALTLLKSVQARRQQANTAVMSGSEAPGKSLEGRPRLASLFRPDAKVLRDDVDPHLLDQLEQRVHEITNGYNPTGNARLDAHLETLLEKLATSPAWKPNDSHYFAALLEQFLRFLYDRFDAQADLYGERTSYLGPARKNDDGKLNHWNEKHLQDDFHQHLSGVFTPGTVKRELWDVAGGRADVIYIPQPSNRFISEVKWRSTPWDREKIERDYLAQAAIYTATGPPFSLLLVGDYSNHSAGYRSIDDSIWTITYARSNTEVPRLIIVGVLPVGRPTPSALRISHST